MWLKQVSLGHFTLQCNKVCFSGLSAYGCLTIWSQIEQPRWSPTVGCYFSVLWLFFVLRLKCFHLHMALIWVHFAILALTCDLTGDVLFLRHDISTECCISGVLSPLTNTSEVLHFNALALGSVYILLVVNYLICKGSRLNFSSSRQKHGMMMDTVSLPWPQQTLLKDYGVFFPTETDLGFQSLR